MTNEVFQTTQPKIDWRKVSQLISLNQIVDAVEGEAYLGFCVLCGTEHDEVEPDAEHYLCEECGTETVFGAGQIALRIAY